MGHKYIKEDDTFSTSRNGTVPKPTDQEVSDNKVLSAGGSWVEKGGGSGGSSTLNGLDDVDISSLSDGQGLFYDSTEQKWKNADPPSGGGDVTDVLQDGVSVVDGNGIARITTPSIPSNLNDLSDVNTSSPTTDDYLGYDPQTGKWINKQVSGGSGNVDDVKVNGASVVDQNKVAQIKGYKEITQSEYDLLPSSKESDGILYCIKDSGDVMGNVFSPIIYSTEEREIGVWIDGKPLYQKTIDCGYLPNTTEKTVSHLIQNIDKIINVDSIQIWPNNLYASANYNDASNSNYETMVLVNLTNVRLVTKANSSEKYCYVTVQYTKTTDTPGSGKWGTGGVPAKHYSTNEQVVGTWIDGKPLYEKTWDFSSSPKTLTQNAWTRTGISNTGIASVIDVFAVNDVGDGFRMLAASKGSYDDIEILNSLTSRSISAVYITLQYIKTTD